MVKITLDDKKLSAQITKAAQKSSEGVTRAVMNCTLDLAGRSSALAPVESGDLRGNCHGTVKGVTVFQKEKPVTADIAPSAKIEGVVSYSLPYAWRQHEDLTLRHDRTDGYRVPALNKRTGEGNKSAGKTVNLVSGGEAKYLEKPFQENKSKYAKHIKEAAVKSFE